MHSFSYLREDNDAELYEILKCLMENWESETVEFKEAKGHYDTDKIGRYFSAISNEANLKHLQYGWLVLGISEDCDRRIVGTNFKQGSKRLLEDFKFEISKNVTDSMSFIDIIELKPIVNDQAHRVLMFKIPAAVAGIPTAWKNICYARAGSSTVNLQQYKVDEIRNQERVDWSRQIISSATVNHLCSDAICLAKDKYKEKMARPHISEEVDTMSDEEFLAKVKLVFDGKVTNAAMLLLGNPDYDYLFNSAPLITWRLYDRDGIIIDYEHFTVPFISVSDMLMKKIRNLKYRYMANQQTLFPIETEQYDSWLLRELINNCLAHSNYQTGGRIYLNEFEDKISISNPGKFLPGSIENVLQPTYNPPFYRNRLLAETMVKFNMIDTATSGIKKIYRIQKSKYFPMPDYDLSTDNQVNVIVYGKVLDERYTKLLFNRPELDLNTVYLLDQVQKRKCSGLSKDAIKFLRKNKLVEGRVQNLYLSRDAAQTDDDKVQYIKNKAFNNKYYQDMIVNYLKDFKKAKRKDIRKLLWEKLPDVLTEKQKERKILTLLTGLRNSAVIMTDSSNKQRAYWVLKKDRLG